MYGLVNQAIKSMVLEHVDEKIWRNICLELKISSDDFESFVQYPDEMTLQLVLKISATLNMPPPVLLEEFGKFFVKYARNSEYQSILEAFGKSPVELIESLDNLHARLGLLFDNLRPPSFWVDRVSEKEILVHYSSQRQMPLEPFVVGLIKGIFHMFNQTCSVEIITGTGKEKALFKVSH
jgi:hypothetical protein